MQECGFMWEQIYRFGVYVSFANGSADFEQRKQKKYRIDISRSENMKHDAEKDSYICANGKSLQRTGIIRVKTQNGFVSEKAVYECSECCGCPLQEKCIRSKSNLPLEQRNKRVEVSRYFSDCRSSMNEKISTEEGKQLRMNRSIQSEGVFAYTKTDLDFRRFMLKGSLNVGAEWFLLALAYNVLRMHHKAINGRLGTYLYEIKAN